MRTNCLNLALCITLLFLFNCENNPKLEYKYSEEKDLFECSNSMNMTLFKDAVYSFEDDITQFPARQKNLNSGYGEMSLYIATDRDLPKQKISVHSIKIFEALKREDDLWVKSDGKHHLNYDHPIVKCISENVINKDLKTTFNALLTTNSMSKNLVSPVLRSKLKVAKNDKAMGLFIALDNYYARFFDIDFSEKPEAIKTN